MGHKGRTVVLYYRGSIALSKEDCGGLAEEFKRSMLENGYKERYSCLEQFASETNISSSWLEYVV